MKIHHLPKSRWGAVKDKTVNIPMYDEDLLKTYNTLNALPRSPNNAGIIPVALKRKVSYKNKVLEAYINPQKLRAAILKLKELGHPSYQNIELNN